MEVSKLLVSHTFKKLPPSLKGDPIWSKIKRIDKPFPEFGLSNCLEKYAGTSPDNAYPTLYIGFTANGMQGLWDLATMSMRGVCSCMHWQNSHSKHLIGSITDPFLGMVYLTDNQLTEHGISFRWRSLVRFAYESRTKKTLLMLERVYKDTGNKNPHTYANKEPNPIVWNIFRDFLVEKVAGTIDVITSYQRTYYESTPMSTSIEVLPVGSRSMSDIGMDWRQVDDPFVAKYAKQN